MKKKCTILLLCLALLLTACGTAAERPAATAAPAPAATAAPEATAAPTPVPEEEQGGDEPAAPAEAELPAVGESVEGFTVKEVRDFPLVGGTLLLFEHDATGAELMYIANSDTNRTFDLTFFTRAIDNTGLPHVFEHAVLDGSAKYPSSALFFNLSFQTYNTFMNAFTYPLFTSYPVASLSEAQLLKYADFYTDSCLHPCVLEDESIYREEAWRYRLTEEDAPLTIEGTVYSEMLSSMDIYSTAMFELFRTAFPGSTIGNVSGGDPAFIPDMTWDALKAYHARYYHPSNCIAYLYGQYEDYSAFLKLLDEAFAPYERQEFSFEDAEYVPLEESAEAEYAFAVESGSNADHGSVVYYGFLCPGLKEDLQEEMVLNTMTDLLGADASPLMLTLRRELPSGDFGCFIETEGPEDMILFSANNLNPEEAEAFRAIVDDALAEVAENGFGQELVDSVGATVALNTKLTRENTALGVDLIPSAAFSYATSGDPFNYFDYMEALELLDEWNAQGLYQEAAAKWLTEEPFTVLVTTYPQPGLREELDAAEAERLEAVKAELSQEELEAIIEASNAEKVPEDASAYVAQLQAVDVSSLPEESRSYPVTDEIGEDGVRRVNAQADVEGVGQVLLLLDASGLPQEDLQWFSLYTALLGKMDTSEHITDDLATLITRYLYGGSIRIGLLERYGTDEYKPYLRASWISEDEDLETGYDLVRELLFDTSFADTDFLLGRVQQMKSALKSGITSDPYEAQLYRAYGAFNPLYAYYDSVNYLDFYSFLEAVEQAIQTDPEAVTEKLEEIQAYFHNRSGAIVCYAGSETGIALNARLADSFLAELEYEPVEAQTYVFEAPGDFEALIVDNAAQFNCMVCDYASIGLERYTGELSAVAGLVADLYLFPMLREQYGVYTPMHYFITDAGPYLIAYADPNIRETFEVYDAIPDFLAELEIDQETLNGYILSNYSGYAMQEGELSGAISALLSHLEEEPEDLDLQNMRELKSLTPEKLKDYAETYALFMENALRFTAGGAAAINANGDLFDSVLNPFGAVDATQVELEDAGEDSEHYEAVRYVFENMLMLPAEETRFGVEEDATTGDLAGALYALLGSSAAEQEEAVAFLADNGILKPSAKVEDSLTAAGAQTLLARFSEAAEVDFTPDEDAEDVALTRGELAELVMEYVVALG